MCVIHIHSRNTHTHKYIYIYIYLRTHTYILTHIHTHTHTYIYVYLHIHLYILTHTHTYTHTYIYIYIYWNTISLLIYCSHKTLKTPPFWGQPGQSNFVPGSTDQPRQTRFYPKTRIPQLTVQQISKADETKFLIINFLTKHVILIPFVYLAWNFSQFAYPFLLSPRENSSLQNTPPPPSI